MEAGRLGYRWTGVTEACCLKTVFKKQSNACCIFCDEWETTLHSAQFVIAIPLVLILVFLTFSFHQFFFLSCSFSFIISLCSLTTWFFIWPYCFAAYQSSTSLFLLSLTFSSLLFQFCFLCQIKLAVFCQFSSTH